MTTITNSATHKPNQRKVKIVKLSNTRLLQLFGMSKVRQTYVTVPRMTGLPDTAVVIRVYPDYRSHEFVFEVSDESFDEIPFGTELPILKIEWTVIELARPEGEEKP